MIKNILSVSIITKNEVKYFKKQINSCKTDDASTVSSTRRQEPQLKNANKTTIAIYLYVKKDKVSEKVKAQWPALSL